jgi:hypothetical protein
MRAYQTVTNYPCPQINAELLLVYRMDYTLRILLCPLVLVVNIDDAISIETCLMTKEMLSFLLRPEKIFHARKSSGMRLTCKW